MEAEKQVNAAEDSGGKERKTHAHERCVKSTAVRNIHTKRVVRSTGTKKGRQEHLHKRSNKGIDAKGATGDSHKRGIATRGDRSKTNTRGASGTLTEVSGSCGEILLH